MNETEYSFSPLLFDLFFFFKSFFMVLHKSLYTQACNIPGATCCTVVHISPQVGFEAYTVLYTQSQILFV